MSGLINPLVNYVASVRDPLVALLQANYATLNTNLSGTTFATPDQIIAGGFPGITPVMEGLYPVIMVKWSGKDEQPLQLGKAGRKRLDLKFKLFPIVSIMMSDLDSELMKLCANIDGLLRQNIQFTDNILFSDIGTTDPMLLNMDGVYVHAAAMDLVCKMEVI
jgi:hypothetical protein